MYKNIQAICICWIYIWCRDSKKLSKSSSMLVVVVGVNMELLGVQPAICDSAVGASMSKLKEVKMLLGWGGIWLVRSGLKNGLLEVILSPLG